MNLHRQIPRLCLTALLALSGVVCTCGAEALTIITTTSDLASIARAIAGDVATVDSITDGRNDPHFLQAKPSFIMKARRADLWIRVGMELEVGWEEPVLDGARNADIREGAPGHLDAAQYVVRKDVPGTRLTRAMGDVHPAGNPHYWLDPLNGRLIAGAIADRLTELDPAHADHYRANLRTFSDKLDAAMFGRDLVESVGGDRLWALHLNGKLAAFLNDRGRDAELGGWLRMLAPAKGLRLVTYHKSWVYFTDRFDLEIIAELEPKPGVPPTARHLQKVAAAVDAHDARLILIEPYYNRKAAAKVSQMTGAPVVVCANSVGGQPGATDYLSLMDLIVRRVRDGLARQ